MAYLRWGKSPFYLYADVGGGVTLWCCDADTSDKNNKQDKYRWKPEGKEEIDSHIEYLDSLGLYKKKDLGALRECLFAYLIDRGKND